jgi:hypothetical protein
MTADRAWAATVEAGGHVRPADLAQAATDPMDSRVVQRITAEARSWAGQLATLDAASMAGDESYEALQAMGEELAKLLEEIELHRPPA